MLCRVSEGVKGLYHSIESDARVASCHWRHRGSRHGECAKTTADSPEASAFHDGACGYPSLTLPTNQAAEKLTTTLMVVVWKTVFVLFMEEHTKEV